jgi:hypothetical protein
MFSIPPDIVCSHCHSPDPAFVFLPVSGRGSLRSWTVVRQSFLPGFDDDLPFVLADVELEEQADLRMIGRLLDGPDAALHIGDRVTVAFEDLPAGFSIPAFELVAQSERGEPGIPASSERGPSGPARSAESGVAQSERGEPGIPASSERGPSGPARSAESGV